MKIKWIFFAVIIAIVLMVATFTVAIAIWGGVYLTDEL
jgi:hypothetical protein